MREIKFRAWLGDAQGMLDWEGVRKLRLATISGCNHPMQYTGLKDKNGVEIYEGDLVLVREARICEVIFHKDAGCWDLTPRNIISSVSIGSVSPASYKYHAEVIGNIHQHPELIKGE